MMVLEVTVYKGSSMTYLDPAETPWDSGHCRITWTDPDGTRHGCVRTFRWTAPEVTFLGWSSRRFGPIQ